MGQDTDYLENPLPSSNDAEELCLGAVLLDNEFFPELLDQLDPEDFYSPAHRLVYRAMQELYSTGADIDPIMIGETIKKQGNENTLLAIGGVPRITNLTFGLPHFSSITEYIKVIKDHSVARTAIRMFNARLKELLGGDTPVEEILEVAERKTMALNSVLHGDRTDRPTGFTGLDEVAPALGEQFTNYNQGITTGVKTGMKPLDDMLDGGGLQRKGVYVVGGAEKSGKTSLALGWVEHIAVQEGLGAAIITLEMSKESLGKRLYSMQTGIDYFKFRPGLYDSESDPAYTRAMQGLERFGTYPIYIADNLFGIGAIERHCTRLVEEGHRDGNPEIGVIAIDYLQIISIEEFPNLSDTERVGRVSRRLKLLASSLDVPLVIMSNLNRIGLTEGQIPDTFNLRDNQSIAFDAEAVMFTYNPAYVPGKLYSPQPITDMQLIMSRQRNGPTGMIPLKFVGAHMQFMTERQFAKQFANSRIDNNIEPVGVTQQREESRNSLWDEEDE